MHPVIAAAAEGRLPGWAEASSSRQDHMVRVADVMADWGRALDIGHDELRRWRAAAMLHDALRDADPASLRPLVPDELDLPDPILHGPAAAARLRGDGVTDDELLTAVGWHTLGHPDFERLGKALYLADFTEPGRPYGAERLGALRERVSEEMDAVLVEVMADRLGRTLDGGYPLWPTSVDFWNRVVDGG